MREPIKVRDDSPERSILARLILPDQSVEVDPLEELHGLATTAGTEVVDELVQRRSTPDHSTYLGKGKVEELRQLVESQDADVVIFDNDLSPAQVRNLEKGVGAKVARSNRIDPRHLCGRSSHLRVSIGGRTRPTRVLAAALEADVDTPFAPGNGGGHAGSR